MQFNGPMGATDDLDTARDLEAIVGHPQERWAALIGRVGDEDLELFSQVQDEWLAYLWTLDAYRKAEVVPRGMGNPETQPGDRLAAEYRKKGNYYADLLTALLSNRTAQRLAPRTKVKGFSQNHQIDVAWPDRNAKPLIDPLICLETKVTGAPAYGKTKARGAMSDWSNRRKELKFAATDLKLFRRGLTTKIDGWDSWRKDQLPYCFFIWGARMSQRDKVAKMVSEVQALTKTYLDGAGVFAWKENEEGTAYEAVDVTERDLSDRVTTVDAILREIGSHVEKLAPKGKIPAPVVPEEQAVDTAELADDTKSASD